VAVIDTGVDYTHPDLAANMWINPAEFYGTTGCGRRRQRLCGRYPRCQYGGTSSGDPQDDHGHGTHVAGIIAAQADNGIGGVGVAYNVQIMAIKAAQYSGVLSASDIAEGIYYAVSKGADVINMSFGGYARSQVEEDALAVAYGQAVLVAAAGNDGKVNLPCPFGVNMYPAAHNWVLGVMASTSGGGRAAFSNSDCVPHDTHEYELMAPGVGIWSTLPGEQYAAWSGTSMAAPVVSGIAALARTQWSDKDVYSSRFIMGQIASNTSQDIGGVTDAFAALTVPPTPEISYLQHWLFDTPDINPINDNDGIVDAGETVDLAIVIRNHWGKAENVTVTLEAWAEGAVFPDPYVTIITDTVNYGAVGSFNWKDNGLIYDPQGAITGVEFPFRFSTDPETPNDHVIPFKLTITATNGYATDDPTIHSFESRFFLMVQRGTEIPYIITEDLTLSKDYFWLVSSPVLITEGTTVTVTEGTQIQFYIGHPSDPYYEDLSPYIQIEGTLNIQGTNTEPVEVFTGMFWQGYPILILGTESNGISELNYAKVTNPVIGSDYNFFNRQGGYSPLNKINNCIFTQELTYGIILYQDYWTGWYAQPPIISASNITNSIFQGLGHYYRSIMGLAERAIKITGPVDTSIFDKSITNTRTEIHNSVFLKNYKIDFRENNVWGSMATTGRINDNMENDFSNNVVLNHWNNGNPNTWLRFIMDLERENSRFIDNNYWGTTSTTLIEAAIHDFYDDFNLGVYQYQPILSEPPETAYPFVVDVLLSTSSDPDTSVVGAELVTFTVTFNRDMNQNIQPMVSFGPDIPMTDYTVHPIDGGWLNPRTWAGTFNITPVTGDGYQLIRVAGAVAADDPWLVTGDDAGRFRFKVETSGTAAMNLQASGGEGYVDLMWTQTDFDLLAGFHLYRSTSLDGAYTRVNATIIPPETRDYRDPDVTPGQPYYYKFTVVKTDMTESDFSNTTTATPIDTVPPTLIHTPVTSAQPGLPLTLSATATDNVAVTSVTLYYRQVDSGGYLNKAMVKASGDVYHATIEGSLMTSPGVEYYIEATDGISITRVGRAENPNLVSVVDKPVLTIVTPNSGPAEGGTSVTLSGSNFKAGATVTFGGMAASNVTVVSGSQITCTTPVHFPATVDVRVTNPDAQFGLLLNGFTFVSTTAQISMPNTGGGTGNVVTVPVNAANIQGMVAASLTIHYDPLVITALSASTGTLTAGWTFAANLNTAGEVRLSMISPGGGVAGSGTLAHIEFEVVGNPGSSSLLTVSDILLNDGAIIVELAEGIFNVDDVYNVSGSTTFWHAGLPVSGVTLTLSGDRDYSAFSGLDGHYTIQGAIADSYTLSPSKEDGDNNAISAYDASFALQHDVGLISLSGYSAIAADVNNNGQITAMDAYYILQKAAGVITLPFPGAGVAWTFDPAQRTIANLNQHVTGQDFIAILLGDISGNWTDPGEGTQASQVEARAAAANLTIPPATVLPGESVDVAIMLDISDAELFGADLTFTYDSVHVAISEVRLGSQASGWSIASNLSDPGTVRIAIAGATPITTEGELIVFTLTALGEAGTQSDLTLTRGDLNEGSIYTELHSGTIQITGTPDEPDYQIFLPLILR
jgi:fibronectin type 3 domain-containing protein